MTAAGSPSFSLSRSRERAGVRARELRTSSTDAERLLWSKLRARRLGDYKFRRQHPIGSFFADFACVEAKLVVELDGGQHFDEEGRAADQRRTQALAKHGFHVIRFSDREMLAETESVMGVIHDCLVLHHPHPSPFLQSGEGVDTKVTS
jgi:very-short-patch-repair endonuclease